MLSAVLLRADREKLSLLLLDREQALLEANITVLSISKGPEPVARRAIQAQVQPNERLELLRSRQTGLIGWDWTATVDYAMIGAESTDTVTAHARKITALFPWRVTRVTSTRRPQ